MSSASSANLTDKTKAMHDVLRQIPYNLFAVCVGNKSKETNAFVGSWITQCSFDPPRVAIAVRTDTHSHELIENDKVFTINLLSKDQDAIARQLVKPSHRVGDKLEDIPCREVESGAIVLEASLGYIECKAAFNVVTGDHTLFVADVLAASQKSDETPMSCKDMGWQYAG